MDAAEFYARPGPITELPWETHAASLTGIPGDVHAAADVARGVLVHRDWAPWLNLHFDGERLADQHVRPVREIIDRVLAIDHRPIVAARSPGDRMVGVCRHFTTLHVAMLRHAGVPARGRVGFARYFGDSWDDHWVTEWWNGSTWVRTDAQVGPLAAQVLNLAFDPKELPPGEFLSAGEAWLACRAGDENPGRFGIFDIRGLPFIAGSIAQDLAALNKVELLPWDVWGSLSGGPGWKPTDAELAIVDAAAQCTVEDDLPRIRSRFREPDVAIPSTVTTIIDGRPTPTTLDPALLSVES